MLKTKLRNGFSIIASICLVLSGLMAFTFLKQKVEAAGVAVTATPNELALTTATDVTFTYTASTAVEASGTTFTFVVSPALPGALSNCTASDTQADATSGGTGSFGSFSTTGAVFTTSNATTTTGRSLCLKIPSISSAASYSVSIVSSTSPGAGDFGAALLHVGDNNDVNVTAIVAPTISFNIRNLADSADTNVCDLGLVDTTTDPDADAVDDGVGECGYSLAVGTNSATGFQITINSDGALRTGSHNMTAVTDNQTLDAGTEEYGLDNVVAPAGVTENNTASYTFQTNSSPVPTTAQNFVSASAPFSYVAGTDATDVTLVIHGLAISSSTPTGSYAHTVTYQATASF